MSEQFGPVVSVIARTKGQQIRRAIPNIVNALGFTWLGLDTILPQLHILFPDAKIWPVAVVVLGNVIQAAQKLKDAFQSVQPVNLSGPVASLPQSATDLRQSVPLGPSMASPTGTVYPEVNSLPAVLPLMQDDVQQQNRIEGE